MRISDWSSDVCSSDLVRTACLAGDRRLVPPVPGLHPHAAHLLCRAELRLEVDQCPAVGQLILRPLADAVRGSEIQSRIAVGRLLDHQFVADAAGAVLPEEKVVLVVLKDKERKSGVEGKSVSVGVK